MKGFLQEALMFNFLLRGAFMKIKSVGNKILFVLVISIISVAIILGFFISTIEKRKILHNMTTSIDIIGTRLANTLIVPIWNFDQEQIENVIKLEMADKNVYSITLFDNSGTITAHKYVKNKSNEIVQSNGNDLNKALIIKTIKKEITKEDLKLGFVEINFNDTQYNLALGTIRFQVIIQILIIIMVVIFTSFFLFRSVLIIPLNKMLQLVIDLAEGDGDLTKKIPVSSDDELGLLAENINKFTGKLSLIIQKLIKITEKSYGIGNSVAVNSEELSATINEIAATVQSMKNENSKLNDSIITSSSLLNEVKQFIDFLKDELSLESNIISDASMAIEETLGEIKNANALSKEKMELSKRLVTVAKEGESSMQKTVGSIKEISTSINFIMDLIKIINNVASQTNLLAMNAAIEAAHAGDSGKGFAVVADEIRSLAETTGENAKNINISLKDIIGKIESTVKVTEKTGAVMSNMIGEIDTLDSGIQELLSTFSTINSRSEDVSKRLGDLIKMSKNIDESSNKTKQSVYDISNKFKSANNLSAENLSGMSEIANGMSEISKSVLSLSDLGSLNATNIGELEEQIKKFKI